MINTLINQPIYFVGFKYLWHFCNNIYPILNKSISSRAVSNKNKIKKNDEQQIFLQIELDELFPTRSIKMSFVYYAF